MTLHQSASASSVRGAKKRRPSCSSASVSRRWMEVSRAVSAASCAASAARPPESYACRAADTMGR